MSNRIRELRDAGRLSQKDLADKAGTSQQQIDRWEKDQSVSIDDAVSIANALGKPLEDVFPVVAEAKSQPPGIRLTREGFWYALAMSEQVFTESQIKALEARLFASTVEGRDE